MANASKLISPVSRAGMRLATDERLVAQIRRGSARGSAAAFEALYERHARGLLSFCIYMLGSRDDAEDAVQATFAAAHRSLQSNPREVAARPWLFAIARNECIDMIRKRRPTVELNGEPATTGDPVKTLQLREDVRGIVEGVRRLPERQRAALVLAEVDGLSQSEIGTVLGVRAEQVKAYVYQARANLISERGARETDCAEIREQLATARGPALRRGRIRRHTRSCPGCRAYAESVRHQHRQLSALLPVVPTLGLKARVLEQVLGLGAADPSPYAGGAAIGSAITGAVAEFAGGGMKALAPKLAAGVLAVGATAEVGMSVLSSTSSSHGSRGAQAQGAQGEATTRTLAAASLGPAGGGGAGRRTTSTASPPSAPVAPATRGGGGGEAQAPAPTTTQTTPAAPLRRPAGTGEPAAPHQTSTTGAQSQGAETWSTPSAAPERQGAHAERHREREQAHSERLSLREERKAKRAGAGEEAPEVGLSGAPKRTPLERQELREEHEREREERRRESEEGQGAGE